jgi:hypothetical protein
MSNAHSVQLFLEALHSDHVNFLVFGKVEDLGQVQSGSEARVEELVLKPNDGDQ